jgi:hypothetical protein
MDPPIKYIVEKPSSSGRIAKWQALLSVRIRHPPCYVSRKAIKGSAIADYLAERVIEDF